MVIDFSVIKQVMGKWIDDNLDHNFILHPEDPLVHVLCVDWSKTTSGIDQIGRDGELQQECDHLTGGKAPFIMPYSCPNPTVENLSELIFAKAWNLLQPLNVKPVSVRLYETENCWADYPPRR